MKLIDILVNSLDKWDIYLGEFATQDPDSENTVWGSTVQPAFINRTWTDGGHFQKLIDICAYRADDYDTAIVTRSQWQKAREALNKPAVEAWNGEGLPPVGIEVEALLPALCNARYWQVAKVVHGPLPDSPTEILVFSLENTKPSWVDEFRPIRTPEQIAAEVRRAAIECLAGELGGHWSEEAKSPHRDMAAYLYDSGWRKQEPKPE